MQGRTESPGRRVPARYALGPKPRRHLLSAALAFALLPMAVCAAEPVPVDPDAEAEAAAAVAAAGQAGWTVIPGLVIGLGYDSNVFATPEAPDSDVFLAVTPSLGLRRSWRRADLAIDASLADRRYRRWSGENSLDWRVDAAGNLYVSPGAKVFAGAGYGRAHEDRTSPDDVFGVEPTTYHEGGVHLGYTRRGPRWMVRVGGTFRSLRYDDVRDAAGALIDNQDRNRDVTGLGLRVGYAVLPRADVFVQVTRDDRRYLDPLDDAGYDRDSHGGSWAIGLSTRGSGRVDGEVFFGRLAQRYHDPAFDDVDAPIAGAALRWQLTPDTSLSTTLDRVLYDTTIPGASGYLDTSLGLRLRRRFDDRLSAHVGVTLARSEFEGIDRTDDIIAPAVGLSWRINRRLVLDADYRLLQRRSDLASAEYDRHAFFVGLRLDEAAAAATSAVSGADRDGGASAQPDAAAPGPGPRGFYGGLGLGHDVLDTRVSGQRGEHGDYLGEFSGGGGVASAFAGYAWSYGRSVLAAELDTTASGADWRHDKTPESRVFDTGAGRETGATLLAGAVLPGGAIASISVGRRRADFDSRYVTDDGVASDHDDVEYATSHGVALEVPVSARAFVRARYEVSRYDGYDVTYEDPAADRFSGSQGRFQFGLGWRFGEPAGRAGATGDIGGFYAGVHGGDDRIRSPLDAVMRQGSDPPETGFAADFGGRGRDFGAFAGYGRTWGRFYAGVEVEADASRAAWQHERLPEGRQFSVEARSSDGIALRLGMATPAGALLYVRGGPVRGRFKVRYEKGENPDAWIDRDDTQSGVRFGVGLEAPLSRDLFLRLDYTRTDYDAIELVTTHDRPDDLRFTNRQHLARIGLGVRF